MASRILLSSRAGSATSRTRLSSVPSIRSMTSRWYLTARGSGTGCPADLRRRRLANSDDADIMLASIHPPACDP